MIYIYTKYSKFFNFYLAGINHLLIVQIRQTLALSVSSIHNGIKLFLIIENDGNGRIFTICSIK